MFQHTHVLMIKHLTSECILSLTPVINTSRIYGMRETLKIEQPPEDGKPIDRQETVKRISGKLMDWVGLADTEPATDEQYAG